MKLTLKIKLLPNEGQSKLLIDTIKEANLVCNNISLIAWERKAFRKYDLHHECYHSIKATYNLSSQMVVRSIAKVSDSYKIDKKIRRSFKELGSVCYDSRILTYQDNDIVSLWCIGGRQKIKFKYHNKNQFEYIKGEADLVYKNGKFYLFQTVDVPECKTKNVNSFIGVDFGLKTIAHTSENIEYSADKLNRYRKHRQKVRSSIQSKGTKGAKKLLKRLSGKERTHSTIINHTISKAIVESAKLQSKGIAIEDLTGIRFNLKPRNKTFRSSLGKWNFHQLRMFIEYKSKLNGVKLEILNPAYTSQTCSNCKEIGKRTKKVFKCKKCETKIDADYNASINLASLGLSINQPEKSNMFCSIADHYSGLKSFKG